MHQMDQRNWLTTAEAAALVGLHPGTLRNRRSRGDSPIPFRRISSNTVLYAEDDVNRYAALRASKPQT